MDVLDGVPNAVRELSSEFRLSVRVPLRRSAARNCVVMMIQTTYGVVRDVDGISHRRQGDDGLRVDRASCNGGVLDSSPGHGRIGAASVAQIVLAGAQRLVQASNARRLERVPAGLSSDILDTALDLKRHIHNGPAHVAQLPPIGTRMRS